MKYDNFDIRRSTKTHIDAPEHYIAVHDGVVYLRIIGQEGAYDIMTATAGEDDGAFTAFGDQHSLNEAAMEVAKQIRTTSEQKEDHHTRPYVKICECEFLSDVYRAAVLLFDRLAPQPAQAPPAEP